MIPSVTNFYLTIFWINGLELYQFDQKHCQIVQKMVKVENTDSTKNTYSLLT